MFAGIDLGTSGCRCIIIDEAGGVLAQAVCDLPAPIREGNAISQRPLLWWQAVCDVITELGRQIDLSQLKSLSVDGTSATLVLTDSLGQPISDALMYNDARAQAFVADINRYAAPDSAVHSASSSLAKLLWCRQQGLLAQSHYVMHQCDWIVGQFTKHFGISDVNNSLKLGYDPQAQCWPNWLQHFKLPLEKFPQVVTPATVIDTIDRDVATELNLPATLLLCSGTTDSTAAVIATGVHQVGEAVTSLGSTLVLKIVSDKPVFSAQYGVYSQPLFDQWLVGGASNSGGAVLRHYFSQEQINAMTLQLRPNTPTGLNYYPLTTAGERFPINDHSLPPNVTPRPDNDVEFFQGLLEGISNIELQGYQRLSELGAPYPIRVVTLGGGASNSAWQQIREKRLGVKVETATQQQAAYGTALLARRGYQAREQTISNNT